MCVQYHEGNILGIMGGVQYHGGYNMIHVGGYHEYHGGVQNCGGTQITKDFPPTVLMISPHNTEYPSQYSRYPPRYS